MEDNFSLTWIILVSKGIIVLTYEITQETIENMELNVIRKVKFEETVCLE